MRTRILTLVCITVFTVAASVPFVSGQEVTAGLVGTVTDPSGAPLAGANVTAISVERGTTFPTKTNETGAYTLLRLPVGHYTVEVEAPGFQKSRLAAFTLVLNQTARVDVQMKMGQVSETVEVAGVAPILQTQSTEVSTLIDSKTLTTVPLAARNYIQLTLLSPGATTVNPESMQLPQNMLNSGRPYINGNREQANQFLLDGQVNNESKNNETAYNPGLDAIQEFNLITQNASAEFGNYQGGVINATIKSGTNSFHGSLFEFFRNDALNANKYWNGMTKGNPAFIGTFGHNADGSGIKPVFRYNQFGGSIGGPIIKNKLFFFADYQGQRRKNIGQTGAQLLTASERAGDFGDLCPAGFTAGICNSPDQIQLHDPDTGNPILNNDLVAHGKTISPVVQNLLATQYYPLPQIDSVVVGNNYFFNTGDNLDNDQGDLKIDYNASERDHVFFRWSQMHLRNPSFTDLTLFTVGGVIDDPIRNAVVSWTHTFGPHLLNEFRVGFGAVHYDQEGTSTDFLGNFAEQLGIDGGNAQAPGMLQLQITGVGPSANATLGSIGAVQIFHTTEGQIEDNLVLTRNRHTIKAGFQYWRERQDYNYGGNNGTLGYLSISSLTGASLADFWLGLVGGGFRDGTTNTIFGLRGNVFGAYVQDDWRVTPTLTVNMGIRFENHTPYYETHDRMVNFDLKTGAIQLPGQDGNPRALRQNYMGIGNWLPRFGLSWSPSRFDGRAVIRAGYGISEYLEGGGANEELTQNPPFYGAAEQALIDETGDLRGHLNLGFGGSTPPCPAIDFECYAGKRIRVFDQHFRPSLTQQWNLTFQYQFNNSTTMQVGYVGQHGTHLLNFFDATQLVGLNAAGTLARPGEPIVSRVAGPFLGGAGDPASVLYSADNVALGGETNAIAGVNMSNSSQRYDALQAVLQKRLSNGLQGQVAYTWSKCMSKSPEYFGTGCGSSNALSSGGQPGWQNSYDGKADWGPCYWDQTHVLSSYVTYQLPFGRGKQFGRDMNPVLNAVAGNWEIGGIISLHSGNALTLNEFGGWGAFNGDPSNTNGIGAYFLSARPNCDGPLRTINQYVPGDLGTGTPGFIRWFDTSNVSHPVNEFGTCSVGNGRGPGLASVDLNLHKAFQFTERTRMEFRLEAINAFNRRVLTFSGGPAGGSFDPGTPVQGENSTNPNFGNITGSQGARQLQLALRFIF